MVVQMVKAAIISFSREGVSYRMEAQDVDEIKTLLVAVGRIETKVDNLGNVREIAIKTEEIAKSAHNRIDDMKKEFSLSLDKLERDIEKDYNEKLVAVNESINATNRNIDKVNGHLNKAAWIVITFVILAILGAVFTTVQ
jgi:hypothetical protein